MTGILEMCLSLTPTWALTAKAACRACCPLQSQASCRLCLPMCEPLSPQSLSATSYRLPGLVTL